MRSGPGPHSVPAFPTCTGCPRCPPRASRSASISGARPSPSRSCSRTCSATPAAAIVREEDVAALAAWRPGGAGEAEMPFMPGARDPPGLHRRARRSSTWPRCATRWPSSAATRRASTRWCRPTSSSTTRSRSTTSGRPGAFAFNVEREYERNGERYQLLRWAQTAFRDLRVVPPGTGIVHQVNLEYLATVVEDRADEDGRGRLPRHARRHRLAHDDDQRPRRAGLRRRRHRGRGGAARPAALPADAARRRRAAARRAAARLDGDRPRARRHRDAARASASSARSSSSPATAWPAWRWPTGRRSRT